MPPSSSPRALAFQLRKELGIASRDFDLDEVVESMGIEVRYEAIHGGSEGLSARLDGADIIRVNCYGRSPRRQRFTLAHELGHCLLGHCSLCLPQQVHGHGGPAQEEAANEFAANLLMPASLFRGDARRAHARMNELSELADAYGVSRSAAALRFAGFAEDGCAVLGVTSAGGYWFVKSRRAEAWWLPDAPPDGSLVMQHLAGSDAPSSAHVEAGLWLENCRRRTPARIVEEVAPAGPGAWLVLLSDLPDVDDDPEVDDREADEELARRRASFRRY